MSKTLHHFYRKHTVAIYVALGISGLTALTTYALSSALNDFILRVAGSYANVDGVMQYYDNIANNQQLDAEGKKVYYSTIGQVHRGVSDIHLRIAALADQRYVAAGGTPPTNTGGTTPGGTNTGGTNPGGTNTGGTTNTGTTITNRDIQVQFYGVPYTSNGKGTLTRGRDYDGYYALSSKIPEDGPFICKAWYSTNKAMTLGREITFITDNNGVSNTSTVRTNKLMMKIDFASDVTSTQFKMSCSGNMGGTWRTLDYTETFDVVTPARAVISSFRASNINPAPNETLTFTWQTTGAVGCSIMQLVDGGTRFSLPGQVANGSYTRNADSTGRSIYRLICTNAIGEDSSASDIDVAVQTPGTGTGTSSASCGSANNQTFTSAPNTGLCTLGAASPSPAVVDPTNASKWKWSCSLGSSQVTCSANKTTTNQTGSTNTAQCGSANNGSYSTVPTINLCIQSSNPGAPILSASTSKWMWTCVNGTQNVNCSANYVAPTNTGSTNTGSTNSGSTAVRCGGVNNGIYMTAPTTSLCINGTARPTVPNLDSVSNKWKWSCNNTTGQTVDCSATKGDATTILGQYAFSPQCADEQPMINLGGMSATYGTSSVSTNYSPSAICKIPSSVPSNIFNFLTDLVDPIDTVGTDGMFNWKCKGISPNGVVDNGGAVTCQAQRVIDAQCGPYANVARTSFDELSPGIRGSAVPDALNKSYCSVGTAMHENGSVALDVSEFGFFHWECRTPDLYKSCSAPYQQSNVINFSASKTTINPGEAVTFNWSVPLNTAFVKCYPVYDYTAQGNSVYDFYNGSKGRQGSFTEVFNKSTVVSLYCVGKTNAVSDKKDISISAGAPAPKFCAPGSTTLKSPDQLNSCNFSWGVTDAGKPAANVQTSGSGVLSGMCGTDGSWSSWSVSCPNKSTVVSCPGGGATLNSTDGTNTCVASFDQRNAGQSATIGNGLTITSKGPPATGAVSCKANGTWSYTVNCPSTNTAVKTCFGGSVDLTSRPNGTRTCVASWGITNANSDVVARVTNDGSLTAHCSADGTWVESSVNWTCND